MTMHAATSIIVEAPDAAIEIPGLLERGGIVAFAAVALWWLARWMVKRAEVEDARNERMLAQFDKRLEVEREQREKDREVETMRVQKVYDSLTRTSEAMAKFFADFHNTRETVYAHHENHARSLESIRANVEKLIEQNRGQ